LRQISQQLSLGWNPQKGMERHFIYDHYAQIMGTPGEIFIAIGLNKLLRQERIRHPTDVILRDYFYSHPTRAGDRLQNDPVSRQGGDLFQVGRTFHQHQLRRKFSESLVGEPFVGHYFAQFDIVEKREIFFDGFLQSEEWLPLVMERAVMDKVGTDVIFPDPSALFEKKRFFENIFFLIKISYKTSAYY